MLFCAVETEKRFRRRRRQQRKKRRRFQLLLTARVIDLESLALVRLWSLLEDSHLFAEARKRVVTVHLVATELAPLGQKSIHRRTRLNPRGALRRPREFDA